jgi:muramidase (phage lysozyme)
MNANWTNWLAGLAWLETSYKDEGNEDSSARGYFQFLACTADNAVSAGLPDPREGNYAEQAEATKAFIGHFHSTAAQAIERGKWDTACHLLRGTWPSLPGGNQPQKVSRYDTWREILAGRGPRPPA